MSHHDDRGWYLPDRDRSHPQVRDLDRINAGFDIHTIGYILMAVGALGVVLWLIVWAPWAPRGRSRRVYRDELPPGDVPPARRYPADRPYEDEYRR